MHTKMVVYTLRKLKNSWQSAYCTPNLLLESGVRIINPGINNGAVVYLDHTDDNYMHLGDLLFFLEIVQICHASAIDIKLIGSNQLAWLFKQLDIQHEPSFNEIKEPGIILTKNDRLNDLNKHHEHTIIGFNFWRIKGTSPISTLLSNIFVRYLEAYHSNHIISYPEEPLDSWFQSKLVQSKKGPPLLIVNSFVASQKLPHYLQKPRFNQTVHQLKQLSPGIKTVCIGTENDRKLSVGYAIDSDLRGTMCIQSLIEFMAMNHIHAVVTFDTFIAHIATLLNIPTHVVVKSPWTRAIVQSRFVPFFASNTSIDYV